MKNRAMQCLLLVSTAYGSWLGMMSVHELGHVLCGWVSKGTVQDVTIPPLGFSETILSENPHPLFVSWGGPVFGCLMPLALWAILLRTKRRGRPVLQFFTGFCLLANGAYLSVGSFIAAGDAGDLMRYGAAQWMLILFGLATIPAGFWLWNGLGPHFGLGRGKGTVDIPTTLGTTLITAALLAGAIVSSR